MNDLVPEQYKERVSAEIMKSATPSALTKAIREKRTELSNLKLQNAYESVKGAIRKVPKKWKTFKTKTVLKKQNRVTVVENQPVYSRDKSRFFKTAWEEERRQLFFK